jgi:hypothetical protein
MNTQKLYSAIDTICKRRVAIMLKANGLLKGANTPLTIKDQRNDASYVKETMRLLEEALRESD